MKTNRLLLLAGLLLGCSLATISQAATSPKTRTYAIVGYYDGRKPAPALVEQAGREIMARMKDLAPVDDPAQADCVVQILFRGDSYRVYIDALPFNDARRPEVQDRLLTDFNQRLLLATEKMFEQGRRF